MGGGHVSRPDFGMPQPDPDHPLTEFYLLLQHGLDKAGVFHLPALYASFRAPARRIYTDEAAGYLTLSETADEGAVLLSAPRNLQLLYSSLHVEPDGSPAALLLTEECSRAVCAVQLLPPFVWEDPLPPLPDVPAALTLQLTLQDVEAIDTDPATLARRLCQTTRQKHWLAHTSQRCGLLVILNDGSRKGVDHGQQQADDQCDHAQHNNRLYTGLPGRILIHLPAPSFAFFAGLM